MSIKTRPAKEPATQQSAVFAESLAAHAALFAEYVSRTERAARLFSRLDPPRARPLPSNLHYDLAYESPQNLAAELSKSILYDNVSIKSVDCEDSLWNGKPQQYFESMNYGTRDADDIKVEDYDVDSLAP